MSSGGDRYLEIVNFDREQPGLHKRTKSDYPDPPDDWGGLGWTKILDKQVGLDKFAGPGGWNDPDLLEVGNGGMSTEEYRAHFSFWCLLAAPLMAGNDLRSMSAEPRNVLRNKELIAINQDALGVQGTRIRKNGDAEVWAKKLSGNNQALILFNRGKSEQTLAVSWHEIGLRADAAPSVRDLWTGKDLGRIQTTFSVSVAPHDVAGIRISPE